MYGEGHHSRRPSEAGHRRIINRSQKLTDHWAGGRSEQAAGQNCTNVGRSGGDARPTPGFTTGGDQGFEFQRSNWRTKSQHDMP